MESFRDVAEVAKLLERLQSLRAQCPPGVTLIAVVKHQPLWKIEALVKAGQWDLGQNYVQEWLHQWSAFAHWPIRWHFMGRLQSNKLKMIVGKTLIHSVSHWHHLEKIDKIAGEQGYLQPVLLQINWLQQPEKDGWAVDELRAAIPKIKKLKNVEIQGLMTMPHWNSDGQNNRTIFRSLRLLRDELQREFPTCTHLSMGTSEDYLVAIQEGATLIRIGQALLGPRISKGVNHESST